MSQLFENFVEGVTDADILSGATTLSGSFLADLPPVSGGDTAVLIIDPEAAGNGPEKLIVTAHTASATTATVTRSESVDHLSGAVVVHALDADWLNNIDDFFRADSGTAQDLIDHAAVSGAHNMAALIDADVAAHAASRDHPDASTSQHGFMTDTQFDQLAALVAEDPKANQTITAGTWLTGGGSGDSVTINHDGSGASSVSTQENRFINGITIDEGHITSLTSNTAPMGKGDYNSGTFLPGTSESTLASYSVYGLDSSKSHWIIFQVNATGDIPAGSWFGVRAKANGTQSYMQQTGNGGSSTARGAASASVAVAVSSGVSSVGVEIKAQRGTGSIASGTWHATATIIASGP